MRNERDESPPELDEFDYELPPSLIARHPAAERTAARLMVLPADKPIVHQHVRDLPRWLQPGDLIVCNATRVLPARLIGRKATGGAAEALILGHDARPDCYRALIKARGKLREGGDFSFGPENESMAARIVEIGERGEVVLAFPAGLSPYSVGLPPLPPYILKARAELDGHSESAADVERYQTVFAREAGSVAAPTAGLHLTDALLSELDAGGVSHCEVVLHVGVGTFRPLRAEDLAAGRLHAEPFEISAESAHAVNETRDRGGRVVAVGTTSVRVLESQVDDAGRITAGRGETDLFLRPGDSFRAIDGLLTNFHLPRSSLLLLAAAFAGRDRLMAAYDEAVACEYGFYSYGDAMLIL